MQAADDTLVIGRLQGAHGVRGWIRVKSLTDPPENLLSYRPWLVERPEGRFSPLEIEDLKPNRSAFIVKIQGCNDRDAAQALGGLDILLPASALPAPEDDEFYWRDLEGLRVVNGEHEELGRITGLLDNGAHHVMVVSGDAEELLIPFVEQFVTQVSFADGQVVVDWQRDW